MSSRAFRLLTAAVLFALLLWYSDPREVSNVLRGVAWPWIGAAVALVLLDRALMAWRWIALVAPRQRDSRPPLTTLVRIFFVSTFLGTFLPASVGGDAVRAWSLSRAGVPAHESFASVLMDRLLGVISILVAASVGLTMAPDLIDERAVWAGLLIAIAGCTIALVFAFNLRAASLVLQMTHRLSGPGKLHRLFDRLLAALQAYRSRHGVLAGVLAASVGVQFIRIAQAWLLGLALGIAAPAAAYLAFVPVILLVMLLPLTANGIGTSQAAFVWTFGRIGVPEPEAFALSVLFVALGIVGNLPGALLYAAGAQDGPRGGGSDT